MSMHGGTGLITLHCWPKSTAAVYGLAELSAMFPVYLCEIEEAAYCAITSTCGGNCIIKGKMCGQGSRSCHCQVICASLA